MTKDCLLLKKINNVKFDGNNVVGKGTVTDASKYY
jgi:hypothetical protein